MGDNTVQVRGCDRYFTEINDLQKYCTDSCEKFLTKQGQCVDVCPENTVYIEQDNAKRCAASCPDDIPYTGEDRHCAAKCQAQYFAADEKCDESCDQSVTELGDLRLCGQCSNFNLPKNYTLADSTTVELPQCLRQCPEFVGADGKSCVSSCELYYIGELGK